MLAVDTPETKQPNKPNEYAGITDTACLDLWGRRAAEFATNELEGQTVKLVLEGRSLNEIVSFGRLLAFVVKGGENFNALLIERGLARVFTEKPSSKEDELLVLQQQAQASNSGLWACRDISPTASSDTSPTPTPKTAANATPLPTRVLLPTQNPTTTLSAVPTLVPTTTPVPSATPRSILTPSAPAVPTPIPTSTPTPTATLEPTPIPTATPLPPPLAVAVLIECIFFDGVVFRSEADEYVQIANLGSSTVDMGGWKLVDISDESPEFTFPAHDLLPGERVRVYTDQVHPEWGGFSFGQGTAVWSNSTPDTAGLFDNQGVQVSTKTYPPGCE